MPRIRRNEMPNFGKGEQELKKFMQSLPIIIGNMAVNFFDDNFDREGFIDKGISKWQPRKNDVDSAKKRKAMRGLLIDSGAMKKGIEFKAGIGQVTIFNNIKYAAAHNNVDLVVLSLCQHTVILIKKIQSYQ